MDTSRPSIGRAWDTPHNLIDSFLNPGGTSSIKTFKTSRTPTTCSQIGKQRRLIMRKPATGSVGTICATGSAPVSEQSRYLIQNVQPWPSAAEEKKKAQRLLGFSVNRHAQRTERTCEAWTAYWEAKAGNSPFLYAAPTVAAQDA